MKKISRNEALRKFGFVMAAALGLLGAFALWRGRPIGWVLTPAALLFLVFALLRPQMLSPIERGWMWFGARMNVVGTTIILSVMYYVALTPLGLVLRALGKDPLKLRLDSQAQSYWEPVDPSGPQSRPTLPY